MKNRFLKVQQQQLAPPVNNVDSRILKKDAFIE